MTELLTCSSLLIERCWAMPNSHTFTIKPIDSLLQKELKFAEFWIDPFAGDNHWADITNDLNPQYDTDFHLDALDFLRLFDDDLVAGVLFDPPYSITQAQQCYKKYGAARLNLEQPANLAWWAAVKDEMARVIKPGGKAICFGWNSNGLGVGRGFVMKRIMLVAHGGSKNDTIVTVEVKSA